ncbi:hypothetical protein J6590_070471 [Homalodisca vitripennis]|nr:hypothetical protein J6590_070471 [Homalodisca vitripennis]
MSKQDGNVNLEQQPEAVAQAMRTGSIRSVHNNHDMLLGPHRLSHNSDGLHHSTPEILKISGSSRMLAFNLPQERKREVHEYLRSRRFRPRTTNTTSGAHGGIVQSRTEVDLILTDFDKDKWEAIVSLPRKKLVKYTAGHDCQHQKSSTIFNNKKYTEENSV